LERSGIVAHQSHCCENTPQCNHGSKHPVLSPNGCHSAFVLGAVGKETSIAIEHLATDGQLDLRRLLNVAHPLAVHVSGADVELIVIQNKPDRDLVGLARLATVVRQGQSLPSRHPPQSVQYVGFHKPCSENLYSSQFSAKHPSVAPHPSRNSDPVHGSPSGGFVRGLRPQWSKPPRCSSDRARRDRVRSAGQICSSWSWARRGRRPKAVAFAAPTSVRVGSVAHPRPERRRYECDCGILVGGSRASPRPP